MGKKNDVPLKERYRLWWEYLQRGDNFQKIQAELKNPDVKERRKVYIFIKRNNINSYFFFLDLFRSIPTFDEWWKIQNTQFLSKPNVEDITDKVDSFREFYDALRLGKADIYFKEFPDDEIAPTSGFDRLTILLQAFYGDAVIKIGGLEFWEGNNLEKAIWEIIRKRKSAICRMRITERIRYKEIKKYLEVYDRIVGLKEKGFSWGKITKAFYPNTAKKIEDGNLSMKDHDRNLKKLESYERRLKMEYAKAKTIIKNAEKGPFPGKY